MKLPPYSKLIERLMGRGYSVRSYEYTNEDGAKVKIKVALRRGEQPSPDKYIVDIYKKEFGTQTGQYGGVYPGKKSK